MILGFVLIAAGIGLAFLWTQEFAFALKGACILGLLFFGLINVLMSLSKQKAARDLKRALHDETGDAEDASPPNV